jgi:DNA-directed RNA polymerase delta subunit
MIRIPKDFNNFTDKQIIEDLPNILKSIILHVYDERSWRIIQRRLGIQGTKKLTLEELGDVFGVTRERIRQLEEKTIKALLVGLIEKNQIEDKYKIYTSISNAVNSLGQIVTHSKYQAVSEDKLFNEIKNKFGVNPQKIKNSIFFIYMLAGIERISFEGLKLIPIWVYLKPRKRKILKRNIERLNELFTVNSLPMDEFDILIHLNKEEKKINKLTIEELNSIIDLCGSVQRLKDGMIWGKFEYLKGRGNQIERLLMESGKPLNIEELKRTINHRLIPFSRKSVRGRTLGQVLSTDGRFIPIGKSGNWGLKTWLHIETRSVRELIEESLVVANKPITEKEIFTWISKRRSVNQRSIITYLNNEERFVKVAGNKWALEGWNEAKEYKQWTPERVAGFVYNIFRKNQAKKIEYKIIKKELMKTAAINDRRAQGMLGMNPIIKTYRDVKKKKLFAEIQENYIDNSIGIKSKRKARKKTLREKVNEETRKILNSISSGDSMELHKLIVRLEKKCNAPKQTLYGYVNKMDFVERITVPGAKIKLCKINYVEEEIDFPAVNEIKSDKVRESVVRAFPYLNVDNVDIGLFLVSKQFEVTLKNYLILAKSKGILKTVPNKDSSKWILRTMIDCAIKNDLIKDKTILELLRAERNARAHGNMPSLEERQTLMKSVKFIVKLYIDYTKLFDDLTNKIR